MPFSRSCDPYPVIRAEQVGDSLAGFFDDFKAKEEETEAAAG